MIHTGPVLDAFFDSEHNDGEQSCFDVECIGESAAPEVRLFQSVILQAFLDIMHTEKKTSCDRMSKIHAIDFLLDTCGIWCRSRVIIAEIGGINEEKIRKAAIRILGTEDKNSALKTSIDGLPNALDEIKIITGRQRIRII